MTRRAVQDIRLDALVVDGRTAGARPALGGRCRMPNPVANSGSPNAGSFPALEEGEERMNLPSL